MHATRAVLGRIPSGILPKRRLGYVGLLLTALLLAGWWLVLAPTSLHGRTTYAVVEGHSMEPMLWTGDLAIARTADTHAIGELVVFRVTDGSQSGQVIHRLVSGDAITGWTTQGDNRLEADPWLLADDSIAGVYVTHIAGFGHVLDWVSGNPLLVGLICASLAVPFYLPWHRRRICPLLASSLEQATHESRRMERPVSDLAVLIMSMVGAVAALGAVALSYSTQRLGSVTGMFSVAALLVSGGTAYYLTTRIFDGAGATEPSRSLYALAGRLERVGAFPTTADDPVPMTSALALRHVNDAHRLPILHRLDPASGQHAFLLITDHDGSFIWVPSVKITPDADVMAGLPVEQ